MRDEQQLIPIILPDLGLGSEPVTASVWYAVVGQSVIEGDRLLEVTLGDATVDLPSPATGILTRRLVAEDQRLEVGQVLGHVTPSPVPHAQ